MFENEKTEPDLNFYPFQVTRIPEYFFLEENLPGHDPPPKQRKK